MLVIVRLVQVTVNVYFYIASSIPLIQCHFHPIASHLGIHHLKDVHEELIGVSHKWYDIGLQLNLPVGTLDRIREQYSDPQTRLREILKSWLVSVDPYPTWRALVKVLKRRAVEEHSLADELKAKHCKGKGKERTHTISAPKAHIKADLVTVKREPSDESAENDAEGSLPGNQHIHCCATT